MGTWKETGRTLHTFRLDSSTTTLNLPIYVHTIKPDPIRWSTNSEEI
jgi:hypothetical protein